MYLQRFHGDAALRATRCRTMERRHHQYTAWIFLQYRKHSALVRQCLNHSEHVVVFAFCNVKLIQPLADTDKHETLGVDARIEECEEVPNRMPGTLLRLIDEFAHVRRERRVQCFFEGEKKSFHLR